MYTYNIEILTNDGTWKHCLRYFTEGEANNYLKNVEHLPGCKFRVVKMIRGEWADQLG